MQKTSEVENKAAVDPAVQKRAQHITDLRAELARAKHQRDLVTAANTRDYSAVARLNDIDAWIGRIEAELKSLEGVTV